MKKYGLNSAEYIKCLFIDFLLSKGEVQIIGNEFMYGIKRKVVDLVVLKNDKIIAVEIKSDSDNLKRLEEQILEYKKIFDYVLIVATEKHINKICEVTSSSIGVYVIKNNLVINKIHSPHIQRNKDKTEMLYSINAKYLCKLNHYNLRKYNADVFVVVAFGQLLPKSIIDMPRLGCINVHASLLPKYRGASPIQWAVIDGCEYSGVTTMKMDEGLDTGDILLVDKVKLDKKETGGSLFDRLSIVGAKLLIKTLEGLETGSIIPEKQNEAESSYVKMLKKSMGELDFTKSARQIECLIRGLNPWPSAFTHLNGKMLKIWDADVVNDSDDIINNNNVSKECEAGTVCYVDKKTFIIKCGKDYLKVNELQLEGKKRMSTDAFLLGSHVEEGTALG